MLSKILFPLIISLVIGASIFIMNERKTLSTIDVTDADKIKRLPIALKDLNEIRAALENYKLEKNTYPKSRLDGREWSRYVFDVHGNIDENWIPDLMPNYIDALPNTGSSNWGSQYSYKSDGANFKLIALKQESCKEILANNPHLIDPKRPDCVSFGYWSDKAKYW